MPIRPNSRFVLASPDTSFLTAIEPVLLALGGRVQVALTLEATQNALNVPEAPALAFIDVTLPSLDPRMNLERLLNAVRSNSHETQTAIILIVDAVSDPWVNCVAEGAIDDLILRGAEQNIWRLRMETALRNRHRSRESETLRGAAARLAQMDHLTGVYNREALLCMLFRETDRVQRMHTPLSLVLLDVDDFGHWNSRLGNDACDDLLCQVARRLGQLLRSYDLLGRPGKDEFLILLPGCGAEEARTLAERIRAEVFCKPFHVDGEAIRLSACFGIASSQGRSPVVVLRQAETALQWARTSGPESIQTYGDSPHPDEGPVTYLSASSGDELLAW